jgi:hypothetical protein
VAPFIPHLAPELAYVDTTTDLGRTGNDFIQRNQNLQQTAQRVLRKLPASLLNRRVSTNT